LQGTSLSSHPNLVPAQYMGEYKVLDVAWTTV
jgi:hypothetical protein